MLNHRVVLFAALAFMFGAKPLMAQTGAKDLSSAEEKKQIAGWKRELRERWKIDHDYDPQILLAARSAEAAAYRKAVDALGQEVVSGKVKAHVLLDLQSRLTRAELMASKTKRIVALEDYWILAKKVEAIYHAPLHLKAAGIAPSDQQAMIAHQMTAGRSLFEFVLVMAMKTSD